MRVVALCFCFFVAQSRQAIRRPYRHPDKDRTYRLTPPISCRPGEGIDDPEVAEAPSGLHVLAEKPTRARLQRRGDDQRVVERQARLRRQIARVRACRRWAAAPRSPACAHRSARRRSPAADAGCAARRGGPPPPRNAPEAPKGGICEPGDRWQGSWTAPKSRPPHRFGRSPVCHLSFEFGAVRQAARQWR